ncbi:MAG TPA: peptidoglycan-binding domain-containing protein [Candidatus Paceibacterota bacterium]|nr:peptidoglycan-binding domain-containing protein [Candidatus Paceibacterota bacterium]
MNSKINYTFFEILLLLILSSFLVYSQEQYLDDSGEKEPGIIEQIPVSQSTRLDSLIDKFGKDDLFKELGWKDISTDNSEYIFFSHNSDSLKFEFKSPSSSLNYYDSGGIKRSFNNIMPATTKIPSYLEFDLNGNLKKSNFQVGNDGGNYNLGNTELSAPENSVVNYDSQTKKIDISLEKGTKINENLATFLGNNIDGVDFSNSDSLKVGEKSESIRGLRGFFGLETEGARGDIVDKDFENAVKKYQEDNGLKSDGKLGSEVYSSVRYKIESKREKILIHGEDVTLPDWKKLEKGSLKYTSEGYFVPKGESSTVSGFDINPNSDVALFEDKTKSYNYLNIKEDGSYDTFSNDEKGFGFKYNSKLSLPNIDFSNKNDWLKIGDTRLNQEEIKQLRGFFNLPTEGEGVNVIDEDFRSAVQSYQNKHNLFADGKLGPKVYENMKNYLSNDIYLDRVESLPDLKFDNSEYLKIGDYREDVREIKKFFGLDSSGRQGAFVDKDFENAVRTYQKENGLKSDGILGSQTYQSMKEKLIPRDKIFVNLKNSKVYFNSENNGFNAEIYDKGEAKIQVGSENLILKDKKILINPSIGTGAHPFKVRDNYKNTFTQLEHNLAIGGFGTDIERAKKTYDVFLNKYGSKSHASACGRGARNYYETLGMTNSQIQNAFGSNTEWYAWQIKDKIKNAGGQVDIPLSQIQPLDVLHIGKISNKNFGHYSRLGGNPDVGDFRHVGVVVGYKDGEPLIFNAGFKQGPMLSKLSELENYYGKNSYSFSRPNWDNANVNPSNFGFDYSSNVLLVA